MIRSNVPFGLLCAIGFAALVLTSVPMSVAHADALCTQRTFSPPIDRTRTCDDQCAAACGGSAFPGFRYTVSSTTGQCTCTCREPCTFTMYSGPTTGIETNRDACMRVQGRVWDTGLGTCVPSDVTAPSYPGAPPTWFMSGAPVMPPAVRPVMESGMNAILRDPQCEVLVSGQVHCTQPVEALYAEQLESSVGRTFVAMTLFPNVETAVLGAPLQQIVHTQVPDRLPPSATVRDLAYRAPVPYSQWRSLHPPFEYTWTLSAAQLESARTTAGPAGVVTTLPTVSNTPLEAAPIDCATPERFVQYLRGYRTSSFDLRLGSANDIAGVCDTCTSGQGRLSQLELTNLAPELSRLSRVHAYARPLTPTSATSPFAAPPLVPAFTGLELKIAAAELRYTYEQTAKAYYFNQSIYLDVTAARDDLRLLRYEHRITKSAVEQARLVYQLEHVARQLQAFAFAFAGSTDHLAAFERYTGRASPALPDTDWRRAIFASACPAPDFCGNSQAGAQRAMFQAVADIRTIIADHRAQAPWLAGLWTRPEMLVLPIPSDSWFRSQIYSPLDNHLATIASTTFTRLRDLAQFAQYLDCANPRPLLDPALLGVDGSQNPYFIPADNKAYVEPRFDATLAYVSAFHVPRPTVPDYDPANPATQTARLEALWLDGAFETVRQRRAAVGVISAADSMIANTVVAIGITVMSAGLMTGEIPFLLNRSRAITRVLSNELVASTLGGLSAAGEIGALAAMVDSCSALVTGETPAASSLQADPELEAYVRCLRDAQLSIAGGFFQGISIKVGNTLGSLTGLELRHVQRFGRFPLEFARRTTTQRYVDRLLDGTVGQILPNGFPPGSARAHNIVDSIAARIRRDPTQFVDDLEFENARRELIAALRRDVDAGLGPDSALTLELAYRHQAPLLMVSEPSLAGVESMQPLAKVRFTSTETFWHEMSHSAEASLLAYYGAKHIGQGPSWTEAWQMPPWRMYLELTATLRQWNRDLARAVKDVRTRYKYAFKARPGSGFAGFDEVFPELSTFSPAQTIEFFRLLHLHPKYSGFMTPGEFYAVRRSCERDLEELISNARFAPH